MFFAFFSRKMLGFLYRHPAEGLGHELVDAVLLGLGHLVAILLVLPLLEFIQLADLLVGGDDHLHLFFHPLLRLCQRLFPLLLLEADVVKLGAVLPQFHDGGRDSRHTWMGGGAG